MKKLWFAVYKDYEGNWQSITGDHGEIKMWDSEDDAKKGLKKHWAASIAQYCQVVDHGR